MTQLGKFMLYIITAVHNRYNITKKFIEHLKQQTYKNYRLILVDDGSTDSTDIMVKEMLPDAEILYGNGNLWWAGAMDKAYKWLMKNADSDDFVLLINDDTNFNNDFIEIGVNHLKQVDKSLITAIGYSTNDGRQIDGAVNYSFENKPCVVLPPNEKGNCASTRALFLKVKDFKIIGGFHPFLLPHYASDYEFTIRAHRKKYDIISFADLKYTFDESTTGVKDYSKLTFKKLFSKRSIFNPIYKTNFIILSTPLKYLPAKLFNQFNRYIDIFKNRNK
jgi:GT2 family glycosyltransferase